MYDAWTEHPADDLDSMVLQPLVTPEYEQNPGAVHERLRGIYGPVAPIDLAGVPAWLVLGYQESLSVLRAPGDLWSKSAAHWRWYAQGRVPQDWPFLGTYLSSTMGQQEGPGHLELRTAWTAALKPFQDLSHPQAQLLERQITRYADQLIDVMADGGPSGWADLASQYARPLPLMVATRLLGFDSRRGEEVVMDCWRLFDDSPEAPAAFTRLYSAMAELAIGKREQPGDDLPSYLIAAKPDISDDQLARELLMMPMLHYLAASLICNVVVAMVTNADVRSTLSTGTIKETVNRAALLSPPTPSLPFRFPKMNVRMGRFTIAAGDPVMVCVAGAHADPWFGGIAGGRSTQSTRAHLAWGAGHHGCLGARLASTIATIGVQRLVTRLSHLQLAMPADQLPWGGTPYLRGLRSLPVQFETAAGFVRASASGPAPVVARRQEPEPPADSKLWNFLRGLRLRRNARL
ncbi:cytochrome P450 family protein [Herbidospora sp. RD11066]